MRNKKSYCPSCGSINPDENDFCSECGSLLKNEDTSRKFSEEKQSTTPRKAIILAVLIVIVIIGASGVSIGFLVKYIDEMKIVKSSNLTIELPITIYISGGNLVNEMEIHYDVTNLDIRLNSLVLTYRSSGEVITSTSLGNRKPSSYHGNSLVFNTYFHLPANIKVKIYYSVLGHSKLASYDLYFPDF